MPSAKDLVVRPISASDANRIVRALHYSGKVATTSQFHLGVFLDGRCGGAMSFGNPIDRRKLIGLVRDTSWTGFVELNRMAFADWLPRNGESRCLGYAMRWIRKTYPHIEWVVSFADATQCGDGTIYRASGFVLTGIRENRSLWRLPSGEVVAQIALTATWNTGIRKRLGFRLGEHVSEYAKRVGAVRLPGYQLRYQFFVDPSARERLTVPIIPFSRIAEMGASMYRGVPRAGSAASGTPEDHSGGGGATPTPALYPDEEVDDDLAP
jgi:hypothetical protein